MSLNIVQLIETGQSLALEPSSNKMHLYAITNTLGYRVYDRGLVSFRFCESIAYWRIGSTMTSIYDIRTFSL